MEHMLHVVRSERVQNVEQTLMCPPSQTTGCRWTHLLDRLMQSVNLVIRIPTSKCLPFYIKPLDGLIHRHLQHWGLWLQEISIHQRSTGRQPVQPSRRPPTIICRSIWMAWAPGQGRAQQRHFSWKQVAGYFPRWSLSVCLPRVLMSLISLPGHCCTLLVWPSKKLIKILASSLQKKKKRKCWIKVEN